MSADFGGPVNWFWQGELQYFIGVQLDGSEYVEPVRHRLSENTEKASAKLVSLVYIQASCDNHLLCISTSY